MHISRVKIKDFRNIEDIDVILSESTNIFYGRNAMGKTNILEAIYFSSMTKSHRTADVRELIKSGKSRSLIELNYSSAGNEFRQKTIINENRSKNITINGIGINKVSRILKYFKCVLFSPEDLAIIKSSPGIRRRFFDMILCKLKPNYIGIMRIYNKTILEKNTYLKQTEKGRVDNILLSVFNDRLAEAGVSIIKYRLWLIEQINRSINDVMFDLSGENVEISYLNAVKNESDLLSAYKERLYKAADSEIRYKMSIFGVHRDDYEIFIDGNSSKKYASQGQMRTIVFALKLLEADILKSEHGDFPIILLDDILSELDTKRQEYLKDKIRGKQVIITCTDSYSLGEAAKVFKVSEGKVL